MLASRRIRYTVVFCVFLLGGGASAAWADNDHEWCDGLHGAAFGLCNAFCNAQECHLMWKHSCDQLRHNYERQTGDSTFPCEEGEPTATRTLTATRKPTNTALPFTMTPTTTPSVAAATATATATQPPVLSTATATITAGTAAATVTATSTSAPATATQTSPPAENTATSTPLANTATPTLTAGTAAATMTATATAADETATPTITAGTAAATVTATSPDETATPTITAGTAAATVTATSPDETATPTITAGTAAATVTATSTGGIPVDTATPTLTAGTAAATITPTPGEATGFCGELEGNAFGLCNAFCNAQACHLDPDQPSCDVLRRNFERETGSAVFPCEGAPCTGDCDGNAQVGISDLTRAVSIVLGLRPLSDCPGMAPQGAIRIQDLIRAVHNALRGCQS